MTDVLIIGDGPAGTAAAITLGRKGRAVTIVQRQPNEQYIRAGESLASSALISLKELGLADAFLADRHRECHGNSSSWGSNTLNYYDFIQSAQGNGWYVDRAKLNRMLLAKATASGAKLITAGRTAALIQNAAGAWQYDAGDSNVPLVAKLIIDAGGRNSWLSRRLGVERIEEDKQIAVISMLKTGLPLSNHHSMTEAVKDGWWYVADTGDNTVCVFFTDPDLHKRTDLLNSNYLEVLREQTKFIKHRLPAQHYQLSSHIQLTAAGSSHLARYSGQGWIAAGDAACSMDPLSSHGIAFALRSGIDAGLAAVERLEERYSNEYDQQLQQAMQVYKQQRTEIYRKEQRWANEPYWQKRQHIKIMTGQ